MIHSWSWPRQMIVLAVVVPLALVGGYLLATPDSRRTFLFLLLVAGVLSMPVFLRWHHPLLVLAWNANAYFVLLPGQPSLWILFAFISLGITVLNKVMDSESPWLHVPSVTRPVLFLGLVVVVTTQLAGGWGLAALGSGTYGGKKTVLVLTALVGYFALSAKPVPLAKAQRYVNMYTLSSLSAMLSNLAYIGGPAFYFLYFFVPTDYAMSQAVEDYFSSVLAVRFTRLTGVTVAATGVFQFMLARYGIRGVFQHPARIVVMAVLLATTTLGGFRSALVLCALGFLIQFFLEGLHRTRLLVVLLVSGTLLWALLIPFARQLPLSVQRAISFLPVEVDVLAKADAQGSTEWRWDMWRVVASQIPNYFWLGKGYAINPTDLYLAEESRRRGLAMPYEVAMISGDYHSGPLSILISFGIFGTLGFIWLQVASLRLLYRNYRWGNPALKTINTFLLGWFVARIICYWFLFGAFNSDLMIFTGLAGLSICLNHGMAKPPQQTTAPTASAVK